MPARTAVVLCFVLAAACDDAAMTSPDAATEEDAGPTKPKPHFACPTSPARKSYGGSDGAPGALAVDETWTPANVYVVYGHLDTGAHTLTVQAGTVVCFEDHPKDSSQHGGIDVATGGQLRLAGTVTSHITLTHLRSGEAFWDGITAQSGYAGVSMQYSDVYDASAAEAPALEVADPAGPALDLEHTTFQYLHTRGLRVSNRSGFTSTSTITLVSYSLPRTIGEELPVLEIDPRAAGTLDSGVFQIRSDVPATARFVLISAAGVTESVTWRAIGLPYRTPDTGLAVGGASHPLLTLEAGTTLQVAPGASLVVGGAVPGATGNLVAVGTDSKPVRITSARVLGPDAGDWGAIFFRGGAFDPATSRLDHVQLEFGGGTGAAPLFNCRDMKSNVGAEVMIDRPPQGTGTYDGPAITHTSFASSAGDGVRAHCQATPTADCIRQNYADPMYGNSFTGIASGHGQLPLTCM